MSSSGVLSGICIPPEILAPISTSTVLPLSNHNSAFSSSTSIEERKVEIYILLDNGEQIRVEDAAKCKTTEGVKLPVQQLRGNVWRKNIDAISAFESCD